MQKQGYIKKASALSLWFLFLYIALAAVGCLILGAGPAFGDDTNLTKLSIEDLLQTKVTSVSRKAEKLWDASAAVYVISQDDIRRSGMTSVPELLRMVPGIDVAHIDSNKWAVSCRGFNERFGKMMLVLIDGRTVYTPLFSGVFWDVQDLMLEDIDRIEVIRGPGATMWGANAVNGIINIITRNARDTQVPVSYMLTGNEDKLVGALRVGGKVGDNGYYRAYVKDLDRGPFENSQGQDAFDSWHQARTGFRVDLGNQDNYSVTVQGDAYSGKMDESYMFPTIAPPYSQLVSGTGSVSGGNLMATWSRVKSSYCTNTFRAYLDMSRRTDVQYGDSRQTIDLDFQQRIAPSTKHELVWGLGFRRSRDNLTGSDMIAIDQSRMTTTLTSAFIQDEITLTPHRTRVMLGSKLEHNSYTGFEIQPNARFVYTPGDNHTFWAAISRAVRTPSRAEESAEITMAAVPFGGMTNVITLFGNSSLESETVRAHEVGYRREIGSGKSLDVTGFYNQYGNLRSFIAGVPYPEMNPAPHIIVPLILTNGLSGHTSGAELALRWDTGRRWDFSAGCSWFRSKLDSQAAANGVISYGVEGDSPSRQFTLRSHGELNSNFELDTAVYWVSKLMIPSALTGDPNTIPSYARVDVRLCWKQTGETDIIFGVRNLLQPRHLEFSSLIGEQVTEVPRSFYVSAVRSF